MNDERGRSRLWRRATPQAVRCQAPVTLAVQPLSLSTVVAEIFFEA